MSFLQGMPGLGAAAAPGALDFLRNNPQVGIYIRERERSRS